MVEVIKQVFVIFSTDYGFSWDQSREPEIWNLTLNRWADFLRKYDPKFVIEAASNAVKYHPSKPPTLGEFEIIVKKYRTDSQPSTIEKMRLESDKVKSIEDLTKLKGGSEVQQREMAKIRAILAGKKNEICEPITERNWEKEKYDRNYHTFNVKYAIERRKYLMSVSDSDSLSLKLEDRFDRLRYISQQENIWSRHV